MTHQWIGKELSPLLRVLPWALAHFGRLGRDGLRPTEVVEAWNKALTLLHKVLLDAHTFVSDGTMQHLKKTLGGMEGLHNNYAAMKVPERTC